MKCTSKIRYRNHCQERFNEKFFKKGNDTLSEEEYMVLCEKCKKENSLYEVYGRGKNIVKKVIVFKDRYIFCVYDKKNNIIRTLYPVPKNIKKIIIYN